MLRQQANEFRQLGQLLDLGDVSEIAGQNRRQIGPRPILPPPFAVTADRLGKASKQGELDEVIANNRLTVPLKFPREQTLQKGRRLACYFRPGQRQRCWEKNCVALGLAGSFIEPLESTTIHVIQRGITHLLQLFPQAVSQPVVDQYNATLDAELQHVRDFVVLHYCLTNRRDSPYWEYVANMPLPPTLRHRIELFRHSGTVVRVPNELFAENSWIQVMMGQGVMPRRHHPTADVMGEADLERFLGEIRAHTLRTAGQLPAHMDYIRSYAPAARPALPAT